MHAMILDDKLDFRWALVPDPVRCPGEVLIRVRAAASASPGRKLTTAPFSVRVPVICSISAAAPVQSPAPASAAINVQNPRFILISPLCCWWILPLRGGVRVLL